MTEIAFGRVMDLLRREAWPHDALSFTSFLPANNDQLSEVVGTLIEITGTAVLETKFGGSI